MAFGESTMSRTQVQLWYNRFKAGREDGNDDAHPDRPSMSTIDESIEAVKKMILDNRRITIREVADDVGISFVWIIVNLLLERLLMMLIYRSAHAKQFLRMF